LDVKEYIENGLTVTLNVVRQFAFDLHNISVPAKLCFSPSNIRKKIFLQQEENKLTG